MINISYDYQKPQNTYTIDQYIACQSNNTMCYHNLSFVDTYNNFKYDTYNVLTDYIDEIRNEYCLKVLLNDKQMEKYKYRPKLLCYDVYGNGELAFIILLVNDMSSIKEFKKKSLLMPTKEQMSNLTKYLFNANLSAIQLYNKNK